MCGSYYILSQIMLYEPAVKLYRSTLFPDSKAQWQSFIPESGAHAHVRLVMSEWRETRVVTASYLIWNLSAKCHPGAWKIDQMNTMLGLIRLTVLFENAYKHFAPLLCFVFKNYPHKLILFTQMAKQLPHPLKMKHSFRNYQIIVSSDMQNVLRMRISVKSC